jgi:hypothetical protein
MSTSTKTNKSQKSRTVPYFTNQHLLQACRMGLDSDEASNALKDFFPECLHIEAVIDVISEMPDVKHSIEMSFMHYAEPYVRCVISLAQCEGVNSETAWCDVPVEFFEKLPRMRIKRTASSAAVA